MIQPNSGSIKLKHWLMCQRTESAADRKFRNLRGKYQEQGNCKNIDHKSNEECESLTTMKVKHRGIDAFIL